MTRRTVKLGTWWLVPAKGDRAASSATDAIREEQSRLKREAAERRRKAVLDEGAQTDASRVGRG